MSTNPKIAKNRCTAIIVACCAYAAAMGFFALVRVTGLLWFRQEFVNIELPLWAEYSIMALFLVFECALMLRILTSLSWKRAILIALFYKAICTVLVAPVVFITDILVILFIPLYVNKNKEKSLGYSLLYILAILAYSGIMMIGRGYPLLSKFSPVWQSLGLLDYKLFLFAIYKVKGVFAMFQWPPQPGAGCMLLFGKFDRLAQRIGSKILHPFKRRDA